MLRRLWHGQRSEAGTCRGTDQCCCLKVNKSDDDISMGSTIMSLRDPLSGARVVTPARFQGTNGLVAFDLETFIGMVKRTRKWQCPHSMRHTRVQELQTDTYVAQILQSLQAKPSETASYCDEAVKVHKVVY